MLFQNPPQAVKDFLDIINNPNSSNSDINNSLNKMSKNELKYLINNTPNIQAKIHYQKILDSKN